MGHSSAATVSRTPLATRSRQKVATKSAEVILKIVPDASSGARATQKYFATFLSAIIFLGFLCLLGVNTLLAQDAFTLSNLKAQAKVIADQREQVAREIDAISSPSALALSASKLGMKPSESPIFLNLTPEDKLTQKDRALRNNG